MATAARLGVALLSSVLVHWYFLSLFALPEPVAGERASLTVLLSGSRGGDTEAVQTPERPHPSAPAPTTFPPLARFNDADAPARATPEQPAGPFPVAARNPERKPYVSAQMTSAPPGAAEAPEGFMPQEDLERAPEPLNPIIARYPPTALSAGRSGHVTAELLLSAEGTVVSVNPWQPEQADLVPPAVEALRSARFRPAEHSGETVPARVFYVVLFTLE